MADDVFINSRAAVYQGSQGKSIAFPDVCLCPPGPPAGPIPAPLPNTVQASDLAAAARTVLIGDTPTGKRSSYFARSIGNEVARSTGGGVISHTVQGKAYFQTFSPNVFIEGEPAVRHLDLLTQNHLAQPGNTPPATWLSAMAAVDAAPGPKNLSKRPPKTEGTSSITILVVDELGQPVSTAFKVATPKNQKVADRLLWGGQITITRVGEGQCNLELPEIDQACRRHKRTKAANADRDSVAYQPGRRLDLATGKIHRVVVPAFRTLWLEIPIIADHGTADEQKFTLTGDGGYRFTRTVKPPEPDAAREADAEGDDLGDEMVVSLDFPGLSAGSTYSLIRQPKKGAPETLFAGRTFEDLFPDDIDGGGDLFANAEQRRRQTESDDG